MENKAKLYGLIVFFTLIVSVITKLATGYILNAPVGYLLVRSLGLRLFQVAVSLFVADLFGRRGLKALAFAYVFTFTILAAAPMFISGFIHGAGSNMILPVLFVLLTSITEASLSVFFALKLSKPSN